MVSIHYQHSVLPEIMLVKDIQYSTQLLITISHQRGIQVTDVLYRQVVFPDFSIGWPVKRWTIIFMRIQILKLFLCKKRFMRIKGFYLQIPIVRIEVTLNKFESKTEGLVLGLQIRTHHMFAINNILLVHRGVSVFRPSAFTTLRVAKFFNVTDPLIPFLATHKLKSGVTLMIGCTTIFPVVLMIRHFMGMNPMAMQHGRH